MQNIAQESIKGIFKWWGWLTGFYALVLRKLYTLTHVSSSKASTFLVVKNASCIKGEIEH